MTDHQLSRRAALAGLGGTAVGALSGSLLGAPTAAAATAAPAATAAVPPQSPRNSAVERRVSALLRRMTLEEKLGQLQLLSTPELARQSLSSAHPCGGVFSVVGAAKLNELQRLAVEKPVCTSR